MNIYFHSICAFFIRTVFLLYGNFQDSFSDVKYTDIDYQVFTDAATYVYKGDSPFKRHTYRYSPILAYLLTPNIFVHASFGKLLFCIFDIVTSLLIFSIQKKYDHDVEMCKNCAFMWLYNPLAIIISTRGSSESIMTSLIMLTILLYLYDKPIALGFVYGFAVHMKIYPSIYAATFYFVLSGYTEKNKTSWEKFKHLFYPNRRKVIFVLMSSLGFLLPTIASMCFFGYEYVDEALLYHFKRKDVRHNFSPYFYFLYISDTVSPVLSSVVSFSSFLVQMLLVAQVSWVFYLPQTLPSCLFIETLTFVTFNKVCTSQYFLWYVCLFPLCYPLLSDHPKYVLSAVTVWFGGQAFWLTTAYYLEFKGENTFSLIFLASLCFFFINVFLIISYINLLDKSKLSVRKLKKEK